MPFGDFDDFQDCVDTIMEEQDVTEEEAQAICAEIEQEETGEYPGEKGGEDVALLEKNCVELLLTELEYKVWDEFDKYSSDMEEEDFDTYKISTFMNEVEDNENYVVFVNRVNDQLYRASFEVTEENEIVFGEKEEVEEGYIVKDMEDVTLKQVVNKEVSPIAQIFMYKNLTGEYPKINVEKKSKEIRGTILKQEDTEEKMIVSGAVLIPDEPDTDGDVISKEKIEEVAHEWMLNYRNIDLQHTLNNVAYPVESYLLKETKEVTSLDGQVMELPEGTWMVSVKVADKETWEAVKDGRMRGFSIMGVPKENIGSVIKSENALKRTTLADIEDSGRDWTVPFFSIVDEPAVPKGRIVSIKSKEKEEENKGFWETLKGLFTSNKEGGVVDQDKEVDKADYTPEDFVEDKEENIDKAIDALSEEGGADMDKEQIKKMFEESFKEMVENMKSDIVKELKEDQEEVEKEEEVVEEKEVEKEVEKEEDVEEEVEEEEVEKAEEEETEEVEKEEETEEEDDSLKELKETIKSLKEENDSLKEFKEEIEKKFVTRKSNQPDGQDNDEEEVVTEKARQKNLGRDMFGRKAK